MTNHLFELSSIRAETWQNKKKSTENFTLLRNTKLSHGPIHNNGRLLDRAFGHAAVAAKGPDISEFKIIFIDIWPSVYIFISFLPYQQDLNCCLYQTTETNNYALSADVRVAFLALAVVPALHKYSGFCSQRMRTQTAWNSPGEAPALKAAVRRRFCPVPSMAFPLCWILNGSRQPTGNNKRHLIFPQHVSNWHSQFLCGQ